MSQCCLDIDEDFSIVDECRIDAKMHNAFHVCGRASRQIESKKMPWADHYPTIDLAPPKGSSEVRATVFERNDFSDWVIDACDGNLTAVRKPFAKSVTVRNFVDIANSN